MKISPDTSSKELSENEYLKGEALLFLLSLHKFNLKTQETFPSLIRTELPLEWEWLGGEYQQFNKHQQLSRGSAAEQTEETGRIERLLPHPNKRAPTEDLGNQICIMNMFMPHYSHLLWKLGEHYPPSGQEKMEHLGGNCSQGNAIRVSFCAF